MIAIFSRNKGAVSSPSWPYRQLGQEFIKCFYDSVEELSSKVNTVSVEWDSPNNNRMMQASKRQAKAAAQHGAVSESPF